jgi:hypothetical protein
MEPETILDQLARAQGLPADTIRAARAERQDVAPIFVEFVERYLAGEPDAREQRAALFLVFHLLGEWREKSAYRPLARLLAIDPEELEGLLGDATTETVHRVMAAVFDGDPRPLHDLIEGEHVEEFIRSRMLETLALLVLRGELDRDEVARYLRDAFMNLAPHDHNFVWHGWQSAIAMLRLEELSGLVRKVFDRGLIHASEMSFQDFRGDLRYALAHPDAPWRLQGRNEFAPFEDTIEELSGWYAFSPEYLEREAEDLAPGFEVAEPAINPYRGVGRNDPCPCGSGKKFKKCCLQRPADHVGPA